MKQITHSDLAGWIRDHESQYIQIREELARLGPKLMRELAGPRGSMSLREVSRRTNMSPTYLSHVATGKAPISSGAFLLLSELAISITPTPAKGSE